MWIPTNKVCGCCEQENLYAKLTQPSKPNRFGKRLYTYVCRRCDLTTLSNSWEEINAGFGKPPPEPEPA